jgi:hypothetical protein
MSCNQVKRPVEESIAGEWRGEGEVGGTRSRWVQMEGDRVWRWVIEGRSYLSFGRRLRLGAV